MKKILTIGIIAVLVCSAGLVVAQENLAKNEGIIGEGYSDNEIAKILDEHRMIQDPETGLFRPKTEGGIPEAEMSGEEFKNLLEVANLNNFIDQKTGEVNYTKLANFTDPVTKIISRLEERGYNDSEITEILEKHGMGWDGILGQELHG
ncbi:MAG: hypothetical protein QMD22_05120 [archaeon]|nr:hypothetical protein [archaeon]